MDPASAIITVITGILCVINYMDERKQVLEPMPRLLHFALTPRAHSRNVRRCNAHAPAKVLLPVQGAGHPPGAKPGRFRSYQAHIWFVNHGWRFQQAAARHASRSSSRYLRRCDATCWRDINPCTLLEND